MATREQLKTCEIGANIQELIFELYREHHQMQQFTPDIPQVKAAMREYQIPPSATGNPRTSVKVTIEVHSDVPAQPEDKAPCH